MVPQPRTSAEHKPLEAASQLLMIWKCTIEYLREKLSQGQGINIPGFGAFTFDVQTELPRLASLNPSQGRIEDQRLERKHIHRNRPVFVVDPKLQSALLRCQLKLQLDRPASQHSVYQKGFNMVFCNPVPIAQGCYVDKDLVKDAHKAVFKAVFDLTKLGRGLILQFGFAVVMISNRDLKVKFDPRFEASINDKTYESHMRRSEFPCRTFWKTSYNDQWMRSSLSKLVKTPSMQAVRRLNEQTLALKVMSLDLVSNASEMRKSGSLLG